MYAKKGGRVTFRSNRRQNFKRSNNYSNGKVRNKGNVTQMHQKYIKLAKEASSSGDRIQTEYYYQFADHYSRLMLELGLVVDEGESLQEPGDTKLASSNNNIENNATAENKTSEKSNNEILEQDNNTDHESIESVSFISEPVKKKPLRNKKESN